jgi:uncharacterized membrane protein
MRLTERHIQERWAEIQNLPTRQQREAFDKLSQDVLDQISRARDVAEARTLAVALRNLYDA